MDFGKRLKTLRKDKKITQAELGKKIGIHHVQVGRYERGLSQPTLEILEKLSKVLEVGIDYLTSGTSKKLSDVYIQDKELLSQFEEIDKLEVEEKKVIKIVIDAYLTKKKLEKIVK